MSFLFNFDARELKLSGLLQFIFINLTLSGCSDQLRVSKSNVYICWEHGSTSLGGLRIAPSSIRRYRQRRSRSLIVTLVASLYCDYSYASFDERRMKVTPDCSFALAMRPATPAGFDSK